MIHEKMTIRQVVEQYPDSRAFFMAAGLGDLIEGERFERVASFCSLESALKAGGKDVGSFVKELSEHVALDQTPVDITLLQKREADWDAVGVIPMGVHLKMLEAFVQFSANMQSENGELFEGRMASAQEGCDWIAELYQNVEDPKKLPDICLGRGYDFFFSHSFQQRFIETNVYHREQFGEVNSDFQGLGLQDPKGNYNVFAVIPAVFIVRGEALDGLPAPRTWEDLLGGKYKDYIAMPDCGTDLPRAVLLSLYSRFGESGVRRFGENVSQRLHPSRLIKKIRTSAKDTPAISIMPYFFSQVVSHLPGVTEVWPEDGTVVEPLYYLVKSKSEYCRSSPEVMQAAMDFFFGEEVASIFSCGNFPALHPTVHSGIPSGASLWWLGWDFLGKHDVIELANRLQAVFDESHPGCTHKKAAGE